ncbi:MAG: hypothetical protein LW630_12860, partial [Saprospiraceae bacterium]|nr:hypothetical protein [Saprospiraceae bacterium]
LKGSHKAIECRECHKPDYIADFNIKKNKSTFLGLDVKCLSCHEDYHQKTMSADCATCHTFEKWAPATAFNHAKTSFPLKGAHQKVECIDCHKMETKSGKKFQQFSGVAHQQCSSCHQDPHKGQFGTNCANCHNETSFTDMKQTSSFNHSLTGYVLEGKHKTIDCRKCHDDRPGTQGPYKEFVSIDPIICQSCHEDVHEKKFGTECKQCHDQQSFKHLLNKNQFDHNLTGYSLQGKHIHVDCKKCHTGPKMTDELPHNTCNACHSDYHKGVFKQTNYSDCVSCHEVTGFDQSLFTPEMHEKSPFPLKGAHIATPCIECHWKNEEWSFREIGSGCIDCHENIHVGYISEKYIPENNCASCHDNEAWDRIQFDHSQTAFRLEGTHVNTACASCHIEKTAVGSILTQKFIGLDQNCVFCHDNIHGTQFEIGGVTDCRKCHGFVKWDRSQFNHDNTAFKLEGAHVKVACEKCHETIVTNGKPIVQYKNGKLACTDCHQ